MARCSPPAGDGLAAGAGIAIAGTVGFVIGLGTGAVLAQIGANLHAIEEREQAMRRGDDGDLY